MTRALQLAQTLRRKIQGGATQFGTFLVELTAPGVPTIMKTSGLDFVIIDNEHSIYSQAQTRQLLDACIACELPCLVRLVANDVGPITQVLDAGVQGIVFPRIRSLDQAKQAVDSTKYAPLGHRGVHLLRPHVDFRVPPDVDEFYREANEALLTCIQIETLESVDLIEPIAALPGVDALYIGPGDMATELNAAGRDVDREMRKIEQRVVDACQAEGKVAGCHFLPADAGRLSAMGFRMLGSGAAGRFLGEGTKAYLEKVRGQLQQN